MDYCCYFSFYFLFIKYCCCSIKPVRVAILFHLLLLLFEYNLFFRFHLLLLLPLLTLLSSLTFDLASLFN